MNRVAVGGGRNHRVMRPDEQAFTVHAAQGVTGCAFGELSGLRTMGRPWGFA